MAHWPWFRVRSSSGPDRRARPTTVSPGLDSPPPPLAASVTLVSGYGPAARVTPAARRVAASCAVLARAASIVTARSAPCCVATALANSSFALVSSVTPSRAAAVDAVSTTNSTTVGTRRRVSPADAARSTGAAVFIGAPQRRPEER